MVERQIDIYELDWQGITLSVSFEPDWLGIGQYAYGAPLAHIEVRVIRPEKARLPITETGYRSHFVATHDVEDAGGAVAYVQAWLDHEAQKPEWKTFAMSQRQLSLF